MGVPVPEAERAVVLRHAAGQGEDPRESARRGTYFGLCEFLIFFSLHFQSLYLLLFLLSHTHTHSLSLSLSLFVFSSPLFRVLRVLQTRRIKQNSCAHAAGLHQPWT
jgi:hypothetical protein